eukprot:448292-Amphidinium_carterae.1
MRQHRHEAQVIEVRRLAIMEAFIGPQTVGSQLASKQPAWHIATQPGQAPRKLHESCNRCCRLSLGKRSPNPKVIGSELTLFVFAA